MKIKKFVSKLFQLLWNILKWCFAIGLALLVPLIVIAYIALSVNVDEHKNDWGK